MIPATGLEVRLEPNLTAPRRARLALAEYGLPCARRATLVVSELVTNAVVHAHGPIRLRIRHEAGVLRVEVTDGTASMHERSPAGRGLDIVDRICHGWGVRRSGRGKTVWAELECSAKPDF